MDQIIAAYDLHVQTVGVIESCKTPSGFRPEDITPHYAHLPRLQNLVVKTHSGAKYLSSDVVNFLCGQTRRPWQMTLGRIHMFRWTAELSDEVLSRAAYTDRSDREAWCANRNLEIAAWIEAL